MVGGGSNMKEPLWLAEELVTKLKPRYDDVAALVINDDTAMVKLWNTEPSVVQSWMRTRVGLLLAKNRRLLTLEISARKPEDVLKATERIEEIADKVEESELYAPLPEPEGVKTLTGMFDGRVVEALNNPRPYAEAMIDSALSQGVDRVAGTLTLSRVVRALATSKGFSGMEEKTYVEAYLRAFKGEFSGHWAHGSTRLDINALKDVGLKAGQYATITNKKVDFQPGKYSVILSPLVVGNLLGDVAFMASATAVLLGYSMFMKYRLGDVVASEKLSMYDVPHDTSLPRASAFDDEGSPTYDKPIIENGVLKNLLHNSGTAAKMGVKTTGNAGWIFARAWNLNIGLGDFKEDELISELRNGLIITNNWYTRLQNYVEGIFSTVSRDATLLVKDGEILGDVGRVRIASKFSTLMNNIVGISNKPYDIMWWEVRTPTRCGYILAKDINITKPYI